MTREAERMAALVAELAPVLKDAHFKKRRHCFNRQAGDSIVHVVYFWMAPKEPPSWTEVPGLRERLYGSFRLDFGVYVPEMTRMHRPRSAWINEYDCHLRRTAGQLSTRTSGDLWWQLDDPHSLAAAHRALVHLGLPWLDRFPSRESVIDAYEQTGALALGMGPAGPLDIADIYRSTGRHDEERRTLEQYVAQPVLRSHASYLSDYLRQHGHDDLAEQYVP